MFEEWKKSAHKICTRALTGEVSIEEFYRIWPENLHESEFVVEIYSDLEDGIQHFPAKIFSGEPDEKSWKSSDMYRKILIDSVILSLNNPELVLKEMREKIIHDKNLSLEEIPGAINDYLPKAKQI